MIAQTAVIGLPGPDGQGRQDTTSGSGFKEPAGDEAGFFLTVEAHPQHGAVEDVRQAGCRFHHSSHLITKPAEGGTHARAWCQRDL